MSEADPSEARLSRGSLMDATVRKDSVASTSTVDSTHVTEESSESKKRKASVGDVEPKRKAPTKGPAPPPPPVAAAPVREVSVPTPAPPVVVVPESVTSPVQNASEEIEEGISADKLDESDGAVSPSVTVETKPDVVRPEPSGVIETGEHKHNVLRCL
jgi:hypothetical protein